MAKAARGARIMDLGWGARAALTTFGRLTQWVSGAAWRRGLVLALVAAAMLAPGIASFGPTDRDESRFAQASKQMLASGDYVDIRFQDGARHQKPIGTYWAQTSVARFLGGVEAPIWVYRLPSLLAGILASVLTAWAVRPLVGPRAAFLAGAMTAGLLVLSFEARTAKADALLLASVVAAQGALARLWFGVKDKPGEHAWFVFYFWTALAVGFLLKGPVILMPVVATLVWMCLWSRSVAGLGRLGAAWGLLWFLLLAAPWFVAVGVKTGGAFFDASLGEDMLGKVAESRERPGLPPGAHLLAFFAAFWPWTALAAIAVPYAWRWRRAPETAFLLGWIVPSWIAFELVATKLIHYTLPLYPAILALTAAAIIDGSAKPKGPLFWIGATLWGVVAFAAPVAFGIGPTILTGELVWEPMALCGAALVMLLVAWRWLTRGLWLGFMRSALVGAGLVYGAAYVYAFPSLDRIWISQRLVDLSEPWRDCVAAARRPGRTLAPAQWRAAAPIGSVRYHEPSLVFLAGTETRLVQPDEAAAWLAERDGGLVWVEQRRRQAFEAAAVQLGVAPRALAHAAGFQYNGGRDVELTLFAASDDRLLQGCSAP